MTSNIYPVGTSVTWSNNTVYGPKWKTGKVIAFVPAGEYLLSALDRLLDENERVRSIYPSSQARYLVAVPRGGRSQITDIYTPYASQVIPTEEKENVPL